MCHSLSKLWDRLEELQAEESYKCEWQIGEHPLKGLDDFMEDLFPSLTTSWEESNYAQTSDGPLEVSTFEVSEELRTNTMIRNGPDVTPSSVLTSTSNDHLLEQEFPDTDLLDQVAVPMRWDNYEEIIDSPHETIEVFSGVAIDVNWRESLFPQPSTHTVASNLNSSERVYMQSQSATTNENISMTIENSHSTGVLLSARELTSQLYTFFNFQTIEFFSGVGSDVNRRESFLRQPSTHTVASNRNRSERVYTQSQLATTNENISMSIENSHSSGVRLSARERRLNRNANFGASSLNVHRRNCTDELFSSTFEASSGVGSDVNCRESLFRQPGTHTVASNRNRSERAYMQSQLATTNENISMSIENSHSTEVRLSARERELNRSINFDASSLNVRKRNSTDGLFSSAFPNFAAGVAKQRRQCTLSSSTSSLQQPPPQERNSHTAQAASGTAYFSRLYNSQYAESNSRSDELRARGLSDGEILRYHMEVSGCQNTI
ncbi:unnamed protein product [Rodentolepis nana]|uniref:RING-type domain-containing protein n=1 Tax=Rodentolepis nana TaxID=102285 RepID=A0A0R3TND1_RODNA|nr:unnamed protein product [Rodentolepis nana]